MRILQTEDVLKRDIQLLFNKSMKPEEVRSALLHTAPVTEVLSDTIKVDKVPKLDDWLKGGFGNVRT